MLLGHVAEAVFLKVASEGAGAFSVRAEKTRRVFPTCCDEDGRFCGTHCVLFPCWKKKASENRP